MIHHKSREDLGFGPDDIVGESDALNPEVDPFGEHPGQAQDATIRCTGCTVRDQNEQFVNILTQRHGCRVHVAEDQLIDPAKGVFDDLYVRVAS